MATGGHGQVQALVEAQVIALVAPGIEPSLPDGEMGPLQLAREFALESAVETLIRVGHLEVLGPAVADSDAQAPQPDV